MRIGEVEVINGGTESYGTDQSLKLFNVRLGQLGPDRVIFPVNLNDIDDGRSS